MKVHAFRLTPGRDLRWSLEEFVTNKKINAAVVLACVGSLSKVVLRLAGRDLATHLEGSHEIVSMEATLSLQGCHLHITVADGEGQVTGGHLLPGCIVYTTAEIVIGEIPGLVFSREMDAGTGYKELKIADRAD